MTTKFCRDCVHAMPCPHAAPQDRSYWLYAKCARSVKLPEPAFYVTGNEEDGAGHYFCTSVRSGSTSDECCGVDAGWFEPRKVAPTNNLTFVQSLRDTHRALSGPTFPPEVA